MATEVWFRNPALYIRELVECGEYKIVWDRGTLVKRRIDPVQFADLYYGKAYPYRVLLIGEQGTAELRSGDTLEKPTAVYPTWIYGDNATVLEELAAKPVGADVTICSDRTLPPDERPVLGQEHRIVITDVPPMNSGPARNFIRFLRELQEDYPTCIFHVHGLYGYRSAFGTGISSVDVEPRTAAAKGKVHHPTGPEMSVEKAMKQPKWITFLGFKPHDLQVPRNRCMFNIKSAVWAGANYEAMFTLRFKASGRAVDTTSSDAEYKPEETLTPFTKRLPVLAGDKFHCNTCSLSSSCKFFRDGAVCSVPGAEPVELAKMFQSRDSGVIIDALGTLVAANTRRLEGGLREEEVFGDRNPEVTKMMGQIFDQGIKLAKLVDPSLRGGTKVQVNVGNGNVSQVAAANPQQMVSAVYRQLQAQGMRPEDITPEMVQGILDNMNQQKQIGEAVQGVVISETRE